MEYPPISDSQQRIQELTGMPLINFNSKVKQSSEIPSGLLKVAQQQYLAFYQHQVALLAAAAIQQRISSYEDFPPTPVRPLNNAGKSKKRDQHEISDEEGQRLLPTDLLEDDEEEGSVKNIIRPPNGRKTPLRNTESLSLEDAKRKTPLRKASSWNPQDSYKSFHLFPLSNESDLLSSVRNNFYQKADDEDEEDSFSSSSSFSSLSSTSTGKLDRLDSAFRILNIQEEDVRSSSSADD